MPNYCKKCGYVFGEGVAPRLVQKGICPTCKNELFKTKEPTSYFMGRIEKSMPTWEDVVRNKYLKNIELDSILSTKRSDNEQKQREQELHKLKNNTNKILERKLEVTCPYCQSTNTKKITKTSKLIHTAMFGIFALGRNSKQWKCSDCGSEF